MNAVNAEGKQRDREITMANNINYTWRECPDCGNKVTKHIIGKSALGVGWTECVECGREIKT